MITQDTLNTDLALDQPFDRNRIRNVRNCWHLCSDGHYSNSLFRDKGDYVFGMNRIGLLYLKYKVAVLGFCLMDNHVHFVLNGTQTECMNYIREFMRLMGQRLVREKACEIRVRDIPICCKPIKNENYLKTVLCYVYRNPFIAGMTYLLYDYPWSSCHLLFRTDEVCGCQKIEGRLFSDLTFKEKREILGANCSVPDDWKEVDGMILPKHYVATRQVEALFLSPKGFFYYSGRSKEEEIDASIGGYNVVSTSDAEMRYHREEISNALFGTGKINTCTINQRVTLAKELRRRYGSTVKQLARVVGLKADVLSRFL